MAKRKKNTPPSFKFLLTPYNLLVTFIFFIIIFLRLWKMPELFNLTFSEEMQAVMAWEQIKNFHLIWIGVSAANINYYLGPGFTYLNAFLFFLSKGDPSILAFFSALLGIVTTVSLYYVAQNLFSKKVALFTTIIYGCSTLINLHDRRFWNPTLVPFITIWLVYSLVKARENTRWFILTAILIGAAFHTHLTLLFFLVPTLYSVILNFKKIKLATWIIGIVCYLAVTSPLIVFDIVHNFDNFLMPIRTVFGKQKADLFPFTISNTLGHIGELSSALGRIWFIKLGTNPQDEVILESHQDKTHGNMIFSLISLVALGWFLFKNRKPGWQIFLISLVGIAAAFILYPSYNPEYYLMSFITLMALAIGYLLSSLPKIFSTAIIGLFIIFNFLSVITLSDKYGLLTRKRLVQKTMSAIKDKSFSIETDGVLPSKHFAYAGWRYAFKTYGKTPAQSNLDQVLGWVYPDEISKETPKLKVIVADTVQRTYKEIPFAVFHEGPYHAYVFENK